MSYILLPSLVTLVSIICESFIRKQNHHPVYYIRIFAIVLGLELLLNPSYLKSSEHAISGYMPELQVADYLDPWVAPDVSIELGLLKQSSIKLLSPSQRENYERKEKEHRIEGQKHFNAANEICVLIPDIDDREKAKELFVAAVTTSTQGRSWSAIVAGLTVLLVEYSLHVYNQWNEMKTHLNWSKYHFEMMEFYQDVLYT